MDGAGEIDSVGPALRQSQRAGEPVSVAIKYRIREILLGETESFRTVHPKTISDSATKWQGPFVNLQ